MQNTLVNPLNETFLGKNLDDFQNFQNTKAAPPPPEGKNVIKIITHNLIEDIFASSSPLIINTLLG